MKQAILIFCILCAFATQTMFSQNAPVSTIGTVISNSSTTRVPITATNFNNIGSCDLNLTYNPAIVKADSVRVGDPLLGIYLSTNLSVPGVITLGWFVFPGATLPGNPVIFNVYFSKISKGTSPLTWDDANGYSCQWSDGEYANLNDLPTENYYINGSITLGNAPVTTAPVVTACPGETISVPVTVSAFKNIGALSLTMQYNPSVLTYQSFVNNSGFPGLTVDGVTTPGSVITGGLSAATNGITLADNDVLYTLNFSYAGGSTDFTWFDNGSSCEYNGPSPAYEVLTDTPSASFYVNGQVHQLVAPGIVRDPDVTEVCISTSVSAAFTPGSGGSGAADHYESSIDAGATWQTYLPGSPLTASEPGLARIRVRTWRTSEGTACTNSGYTSASWDVAALSIGGTLDSDASVCAGTNSTLLTLTGYNGVIVKWQSSLNGTDWSDITHTDPVYTASDLATTTLYRVVVQNSVCDPVNSSVATVTVNPVLPVSVTIAAGANPVCAGTTVSFTSIPVNGGATPGYQWQINAIDIPGATDATFATIPAHNDAVTCVLTSSETVCVTGNPATSNTVTMTINPLIPVSVTIAADVNPVNAGTLVTFTTAPVNGGASPSFQWKVNNSAISGATNSVYAYVPVNNDAVTCTMTSDLVCVSGNPATSNTVIMAVNSIPENLAVQDVTIGSGQTECYNALQTIIVAGGSTIFVVGNNGSATFIAGQAIRFLPGTTVQGGGYLHGQIAPSGPFCGGIFPPADAIAAGEAEVPTQAGQDFFMIYPNPTGGNFTLARKDGKQDGNVTVELLGMRGERVLKAEMTGEQKHEFSMPGLQPGLYFVKIIAGDHTETIKLMKTR